MKKLLTLFQNRNVKYCSAVIVAAGSSSRMKGEDKLLLDLCGRPVIWHTIRLFQICPLINEIVIVTRTDLQGYIRSLCAAHSFDKVKSVVEGGSTRAHSVMCGLDHVSKKSGLVAIHDGARPLASQDVVENAVQKAAEYYAAAPAVPVKDTIKSADRHIVTHTPDRSTLFAIQTPQVFDYDLLRGALQKALDEKLPITVDCSAVEALGMSVYLSEGSEENIKITTPMDMLLAEAIYKRREQL